MNNKQDVQKKINELRRFARNQKVVGFDVEAYVEKALEQMGIVEG